MDRDFITSFRVHAFAMERSFVSKLSKENLFLAEGKLIKLIEFHSHGWSIFNASLVFNDFLRLVPLHKASKDIFRLIFPDWTVKKIFFPSRFLPFNDLLLQSSNGCWPSMFVWVRAEENCAERLNVEMGFHFPYQGSKAKSLSVWSGRREQKNQAHNCDWMSFAWNNACGSHFPFLLRLMCRHQTTA